MVEDKTKGRVLLPSTITPTRYDIKLKPDLEAFTFTGEEVVTVTTSADVSTNEIVMHAKELCFTSASYKVTGGDGTVVDAEEIHVNIKATTVTFLFSAAVPASSTLEVTIHFIGFLNNQMAGFYRSSYTDIHGESKIMASTQFEALDARRAFPCWDEPSCKAVFGVTLIVPRQSTAFSNMPEKSSKELPCGKLREIAYLDSPKMSSYLVAFVVGEFDFVQDMTKHGVVVRVYTPPGKSETGLFSLKCACDSLDLYDDFFGIPYPLPKLDMVGIPEFAMGAMENWGLVTYRETDLLIDVVKASPSQKQRVCTVVTHELAHQWFGNLVTMAWWDDLWLNEGFASWAENYAADILFPGYKMWEQFVTGHLSSALRLDAMKSSHPIQVPIYHAEEVEEVFDAISYCKGGSVVKMIYAVLGHEAFRIGLGNYMKSHAYGNTETFNLWDAWEESSGLPVKEMMASWTEQMGFPLVRVVGEEWKETEVTLELSQSWFLSDGSDVTEEDKEKKWTIPILTCTQEGTQQDTTFMREATAKVTIPLSSPNGWVKLNAGQEVPMRVCVTEKMMERLAVGIQNKILPVCDRAGMLNDAYALVKAGKMEPGALIRLLSNFKNEDNAIVWEGIEGCLNGLDIIMSDDKVMNLRFKKFARGLVKGLTEVVSWEPSVEDGHLTSLLRGTMIRLLSIFCFDDEQVLAEATHRFQAFLEDAGDVQSLPSEIRPSVFKIILKNGGLQEYEQILSYFDTASDGAERKHVMASLGHATDPKLKLRTMEWALSGKIKLQDFFYPMGSVGSSSREGKEISWNFYKQNFDAIKNMIGKASPSLMDACIVYCGGGFCSTEKADEFEAFFETHALPLSARRIAQSLESMRTNAAFLDKLRASELAEESFWEGVL